MVKMPLTLARFADGLPMATYTLLLNCMENVGMFGLKQSIARPPAALVLKE